MIRDSKFWIIGGIGVFVISFLLAVIFGVLHPPYRLDVVSQYLGPTVSVRYLALANPGFVVVQKTNDKEHPVVIGQSDYLPPGVWKNLHIDIYYDQIAGLRPGDRINFFVAVDNGDKVFSMKNTTVGKKEIESGDKSARYWYGPKVEKTILFW